MANTIIHPKPAHLAGDSAKFHSKLVGGKAKKVKKSMKKAMKGKKGKKPMRKTMKKTKGGSFIKGIRNRFMGRKPSGLISEETRKNWWKDAYNAYIQDEICKGKKQLKCEKSWFSDGQQINDFVVKKWDEFPKKYKVKNKSTNKLNKNLSQSRCS